MSPKEIKLYLEFNGWEPSRSSANFERKTTSIDGEMNTIITTHHRIKFLSKTLVYESFVRFPPWTKRRTCFYEQVYQAKGKLSLNGLII